MKKTITEVETAIENRIAELEEEYELDIYDRNDIREEEYQKGWGSASYPQFWFGMIHKTAARCLCTLWRRFSLLSLL